MKNLDGKWRVWLGDLGDHDAGTLTLESGRVTGAGEFAGKGTYRIENDDLIVEIALGGLVDTVDRYVFGLATGQAPEAPKALSGVWTSIDPDDGSIDMAATLLRV
jgi:hypothetical protein